MDDKIISNISYTNKDFQSIYPELLDLVKKLTNKWDPSLSNESDPGVILLKLNALIADKNNYNIDKNVLECFPTTVTQDGNARRIYDSLGYNMHWYKSATTDVGIQLKTNEGINSISNVPIPQFTMVCDINSEVVYTLLDTVNLSCLSSSLNTVYTVPAIEGRCVSYEVNGSNDITLDMLDSDYRIYFDEPNVAENGIFIKTSDDAYWTDWSNVTNLQLQPLGTKCFKFGILPNTNTCYIEFPQDIAALLNEAHALNINYILSNGTKGNIKASLLKTFLNDVEVTVNESKLTITDQIAVVQPTGTINGSDPETVDDAYKNYKRTIGTFETLVTKKDYENAIYNAKDSVGINNLVSNVVVSDRTNDLNSTLKVQTWTPNYNVKNTLVMTKTIRNSTVDEEGVESVITKVEPMLSAYDIVLYILNVGDGTYDSTFEPNVDVYLKAQLEALMEQSKSIQHNLVSLSDLSNISSAIYYLYKNLYALKGQIVTHERVSTADAQEIESNVMAALQAKYNARNLIFGDEVDYVTLIETIQNADSRIKTVALDMPQYQIHRVGNKLTGDSSTIEYGKYINSNNTIIWRSTEDYNETSNVYLNKQAEADEAKTLTYDEKLTIVAKMILAGNVQLFKFDENFGYDFGYKDVENVRELDTYIPSEGPGSKKLTLATTEAKIHLETSTNSENLKQYVVKQNEVVQAFAPSFVAEKQYTNYVKVYYHNRSDSEAYTETDDESWSSSSTASYYICESNNSGNYSYKLLTKTEISAYLSPSNYLGDKIEITSDKDEDAKKLLPYVNYYESDNHYIPQSLKSEFVFGNFIIPKRLQEIAGVKFYEYDSTALSIPADTDYIITENDVLELVYTDDSKVTHKDRIPTNTIIRSSVNIKPKAASDYDAFQESDCIILTTNQSISIMKLNKSKISIGSKCYWILNNSENELKLDKHENITSIILQENEYLLYTNNTASDIIMLGSGTMIELGDDSESFIAKCDLIDVNNFDVGDINWIELTQPLEYTELDIVSAGPGSIIELTGTVEATLDITNRPKTLTKDTGALKITDSTGTSVSVFKYPDGKAYSYYKVQSRLNLVQNQYGYQELESDKVKIIDNISTNNSVYSEQSVTLIYKDSSGNSDERIISASKKLYFNALVTLPGGVEIDLGVTKDGKKAYTLEAFTFEVDQDYSANNTFARDGGIIKIAGNAYDTNFNNNNEIINKKITLDTATNCTKIELPIGFKADSSKTDTYAAGWFVQFYLTVNSSNFNVLFTTKDSEGRQHYVKNFAVSGYNGRLLSDLLDITVANNRKRCGYNQTGSYILWIPNDNSYENLTIYMENGTDSDIISIGKVRRMVGFNTDEINVIPNDDNGYSVYDYFKIDDTDFAYKDKNKTIDKILEEHSSDFELLEADLSGTDLIDAKVDFLNKAYKYNNICTKIEDLIANSSNTSIEFDYTYEVPDSEKVLQPTLSSSYFNKNHWANRYTIPQIRFDKSSIKVNSYSIKS